MPSNASLVRQPKTKSRFWSKKNLNFEAKIKILGFSMMAISNFGVSNWNSKGIGKSDFQNFEIKFPPPKFKIDIEFQVSTCGFLNFGDRFWISISKIQNRNRISSFDVPISDFRETKLFKNRNFKFWQSRILHFHPISIKILHFVGSIYRIFSRISLNTRKFGNFSSTLIRLQKRSTTDGQARKFT